MGKRRFLLLCLCMLLIVTILPSARAQEVDWRARAEGRIPDLGYERARVEKVLLELQPNLTQTQLSISLKELSLASDHINNAQRYFTEGKYNLSLTQSALAKLRTTRAEYGAHLRLANNSLNNANRTISSMEWYLGIPQYAVDIFRNATSKFERYFASYCLYETLTLREDQAKPEELDRVIECVRTMEQHISQLTTRADSVLNLAKKAETSAKEYRESQMNIFWATIWNSWVPLLSSMFLLGLVIGTIKSTTLKKVPTVSLRASRATISFVKSKYHQPQTEEAPNSKLVDDVISTLDNINSLSKNRFNVAIFKENAKLLNDLRTTCKDEKDFVFVVATIGSLINDVEEGLRSKVGETKDGTINLLQSFLDKYLPDYDKSIISIFRDLYKLRSKKSPIHRGESQVVEILKKWHLSYPPDWKLAGRKAVEEYFRALELLRSALQR